MKPAVATTIDAVTPPEQPPRGSRNRQVVERFFDAVLEGDRERILSFFSEESRLEQGALQPATGAEAIWQSLAEGMRWAERLEWDVSDMQETDCGMVLARHGGRYLARGCWHDFQLDDCFEVRGCKILSWRAARG